MYHTTEGGLLARGENPHTSSSQATGPGSRVTEWGVISCRGQTDLTPAIHHSRSHSGIADLAPNKDSQQPSGSSNVWSSQEPSSLVVPVHLASGPSTLSNKAVTNQQLEIRGPYRSVV